MHSDYTKLKLEKPNRLYLEASINSYKNYLPLCVQVFCLHACLCILCMPGVHRGQKMALDPLQLELHIFESHQVKQGIKPESSGLSTTERAISPVKYQPFKALKVSTLNNF